MKRIVAAIQKKTETAKAERKVKRVFRSIDIAKDNAQDRIDEAEAKMAALTSKLYTMENLSDYLTSLSVYLDTIECQKETIKRLDAIKAYLEEDIEVEEK